VRSVAMTTSVLPPPDLSPSLSNFHDNGYALVDNLIPNEIAKTHLRESAKNKFEKLFSLLSSHRHVPCARHKYDDKTYSLGLGARNGFNEIVRRSSGRYEFKINSDTGDDVNKQLFDATFDRLLSSVGEVVKNQPSNDYSNDINDTIINQTVLADALNTIFSGHEFKLVSSTIVLSTPESTDQSWHVDGPHIDASSHQPAHVVNIFIPLVDMTESLGGTEIRPGTHFFTRDMAKMMLGAKARKELRDPVTPMCAAGDALVFDYRTLHRGRANVTKNADRPVLVLTFGKSWYKDIYNFPPRSLFKRSVTIEYFTDVEGNWEYFCKLVENSGLVRFGGGGELLLADDAKLVFGGDSVDKGPGDIRVVKCLVEAKERYGSRVVLILGNRDINKLLLYSALTDENVAARNLLDVYWVDKYKTYDDYLVEHNVAHDKVSVLKWMLAETMGSATTFETRRSELNREFGLDATDADVVESFANSVDPKSDNHFMLKLCQLGVIAHYERSHQALFVHGGISSNCIGNVPGLPKDGKMKLTKWVDRLNEWKDKCLANYIADPSARWSGGKSPDPESFSSLLDYGVPGGNDSGTVIYNNHIKNGNCENVDKVVADYLFANGVSRVFVGHQPHGFCPSVIQSPNGRLNVFMCDTSYSDMSASKENNLANNRGECFSNVTIGCSWTEICGQILNERRNKFLKHVDNGSNNDACKMIGKLITDEFWVKGLVDTGELMIAKGEGYKLDIKYVALEDLEAYITCHLVHGLAFFSVRIFSSLTMSAAKPRIPAANFSVAISSSFSIHLKVSSSIAISSPPS